MNSMKYAISKYPYWISGFSLVLGVVSVLPLCDALNIIMVVVCLILPFVIPLIQSCVKKHFEIKTLGKSEVEFEFNDLFDEDYIVITTNRFFDIDPSNGYISEDSLIGKFVKKKCENNVHEIEEELKSHLEKDSNDNIIPANYGEYIKKVINGQTVYFLVFTDRRKSDQPKDFYVKTVQGFLDKISDENHGKTICVPLLGSNNNLSDTGFTDNEMSLVSLIVMINNFEISNQRSKLKLKIMALPEMRNKLIGIISKYCK